MASPSPSAITLPYIDDFHVHLRQGAMMKVVAPTVKQGGVGLAYVMPNLKPTIATTDAALAYKAELEALSPDTTFLMTLYLSPELTPAEVAKAAKAGISGVKSYPRGVTTNSEGGIESYTAYYEVFRAMEEHGMVLNLHGEVPSDHDTGGSTTILNAEERFLRHLVQLHADFPKLRIVLEHATTAAAVETVKSLGDTVGCTITVHHLSLVVDDWAANRHNFCKPVAKTPEDRKALQDVVKEGHPRFFLGTDSAPHPRTSKEAAASSAGVFTSPYVLQYTAHILESFGALDRLRGFACEYGRRFYRVEKPPHGEVTLARKEMKVVDELKFKDDEGKEASVVPFLAGRMLNWSIQ